MRPIIDPADVGDAGLVVRTDYSSDVVWRTVAALLDGQQDDDGWVYHVVDDPAWAGASVDEVLTAAPKSDGVVYIADSATMRDPYPLLAVNTTAREDCEDDEEYDYQMQYGREFRVLPSGLVDVSANLAIANMDFPEFAAMAQADPHSCYRGSAAAQAEDAPEPTPWDGWVPCDGHLLRRGQTLRDACITSPNGRYALSCFDGLTCLTRDGVGIWMPVGQGSGTGIELGPEGELRYRAATGGTWPLIPDFGHLAGRRKRWPKDERGGPGPAVGAHALAVRDDGDIDLVDEDGRTMWSFGTAHHVRLLDDLRAMAITRPTDALDE
ncbi:hypothetical protein ABZ832_07940 [Streptantibioticus parmotrematis]|uniref:DUF6924 domain-containing protein n=1 Tax=Streptantibioticus parmotrematis TaxID=2873249 RepID=UPI003402E71C